MEDALGSVFIDDEDLDASLYVLWPSEPLGSNISYSSVRLPTILGNMWFCEVWCSYILKMQALF
jgi:hypothetical protein